MWSQIEAELFDIAIASFSTPDKWAIEEDFRLAFYTINGAEIRLAITHALVSKMWGSHQLQAEWDAIYKEINSARKDRNKLAHKYGTTIWDETAEAALLIQPQRDSGFPASIGIAKSRGIDSRRLQSLRAEWGRLRARMHRFRLDAERARIEAFLEPQAGPGHQPRTRRARTAKAPK